MRHPLAALVLMVLAGRASAAPEVVSLSGAEGPFANAFEDKCKSLQSAPCQRIASARVEPFQRVEFHRTDTEGYLAIEHGNQWFIGPAIWLHGVSDPTTSQFMAVTSVQVTGEAMPELGKVAVLQLGVHVRVASHCSRRGHGCNPGTPDYRGTVEEYDDSVFMVCGIVGNGPPRCSRPIVVPQELVRRPAFTSGALVLSTACTRFDWRARGRRYDHSDPAARPRRSRRRPPASAGRSRRSAAPAAVPPRPPARSRYRSPRAGTGARSGARSPAARRHRRRSSCPSRGRARRAGPRSARRRARRRASPRARRSGAPGAGAGGAPDPRGSARGRRR